MQNRVNVIPEKKYRRLRRKWLFMFIIIAAAILWAGIWGEKDTDKEPETEIIVTKKEQPDDYKYLEESPEIRVILMDGNYENLYHDKLEIVFPSGGYILTCVGNQWEKDVIKAGKEITVGLGEDFDYSMTQDMLVAFVPGKEEDTFIVNGINRNRATCSYYGRLEVSLEKGGLLAINSLPLETYLCGVVPSEMPASYNAEALSAQAILARTYAYKYLISPAYAEYGAHVDDSISFQVYGNIDQADAASAAVKETTGVLLFLDRSLAEVYYYSTSCGYGADGTTWGGDGQIYLKEKRIGPGALKTADGSLEGEEAEQYYLESLQQEEAFREMIIKPFVKGYEGDLPWYRWSAENVYVDSNAILARLKERYNANPNVILKKQEDGSYISEQVTELGNIKNISVAKRASGGCLEEICIEGEEADYKILREYNIRYVLNGSGTEVVKADGSVSYCATLLPSGFFYIEPVYTGDKMTNYHIYGGGYGHGVGMSQNGANEMAKAGQSCQEILEFFFPDTVLVSYERNS